MHRVPPAASLSVASRHLAGKILSYLESDVEVYSGEEANDRTTTTTSVMDFIEEVRRPASLRSVHSNAPAHVCHCAIVTRGTAAPHHAWHDRGASAVRWAPQGRERGENVLVHCRQGRNRARQLSSFYRPIGRHSQLTATCVYRKLP